ncbi:MAG: D-alanyl-D-alanine carboxypeptidase/D-alanyl-D-alanine-endopeptidase [Gammaproteobacteria bacterium]|nr:D-alanyl-D-alanine carboxypeptidase/D-alanyl-D-alanine-endopeptidase [Gammaproteobacteria bacterium]
MRPFLLLCLIGLHASTIALAEPDTAPSVERVIEQGALPDAAVSYLVQDVADGRVLLARHARVARAPGSTIKLLTTYAALDELGPAYTFHTRARTSAPIAAGVLHGDLYLQGGGDPYLTLERWWRFAAELRATGLRTIRGDVVIDDHAYSLPAADPAAFDGHPNRPYNVLPNALMVNFQSIDFRIVADPRTQRVRVSAIPWPVNFRIDDRIRLIGGRCSGAGDRIDYAVASAARDHVVFSGTLSARCKPIEITHAVMRAPQYAFGTFAALWRELGGRIRGGLRIGATPPGAGTLLDFESAPLADLVKLTDKYSNNLMAREIFLALGAARFGAPATLAKGVAAVEDWARARAIPLDGLVLDNGSGLSRRTRVSAETLAALLRTAYHGRYAPEFLASLPLAGIDGTLREHLRETPPGAVRLKTGHIDDASAVAGYVTTHGQTYVLVSMINDPRVATGAAERVHQALVDWVLAHR